MCSALLRSLADHAAGAATVGGAANALPLAPIALCFAAALPTVQTLWILASPRWALACGGALRACSAAAAGPAGQAGVRSSPTRHPPSPAAAQNCAWFGNTQKCDKEERWPGLWEVPMWVLQAFGLEWTMDVGYYGGRGVYEPLRATFEEAYNGNRAPLPIFLHTTWWARPPACHAAPAWLCTPLAGCLCTVFARPYC